MQTTAAGVEAYRRCRSCVCECATLSVGAASGRGATFTHTHTHIHLIVLKVAWCISHRVVLWRCGTAFYFYSIIWFYFYIKGEKYVIQFNNSMHFPCVCSELKLVDSSLQCFNSYWFVLHVVSRKGAQHHGAPRSMARHATALPHMSPPADVCLCTDQRKSEDAPDVCIPTPKEMFQWGLPADFYKHTQHTWTLLHNSIVGKRLKGYSCY